MAVPLNKAFRHTVLWLVRRLPTDPRRRLERRFRGWEEAEKLAAADIVVVSFGKSGRTWLRVMMSRFYQLAYGLAKEEMLGFDNLHRRDSRIPRVLFTHDNYLKDYTGHADSKVDYLGKRIVLLVRNPKDVAVSLFFQWKHRMRPGKKILNHYPEDSADVSVYDFVTSEIWGLSRVIRFMNLWAQEAHNFDELLIVRYEDLRTDPEAEFRKVMAFIGDRVAADDIRDAVEYASIENMRRQEENNDSRFTSGRMKPGQKGVQDSYKVRRAKVGGYRDYFSTEEIEAIDAQVASTLSPVYRYDEKLEESGGESGGTSASEPTDSVATVH